MTDPSFYMTMAATALAGVAILAYTTLTGWRGWLALKQQELQHQLGGGDRAAPAMPNASARIEIADLKERIRKLEAIAAGVDL